MSTISLCMIVKNEEAVLARCLDSVAGLVDEIIIVDTGSTDKTMEIAEYYTDKVYSFAWVDDFAAARNYSFSKATMDYCMWLDADDVIDDSQREEFTKLKETLAPTIDFVMMRYSVAFNKNDEPEFWYYRERWIRNNGRFKWDGAVHEAISPSSQTIYSDVSISHRKEQKGDPDRNLRIYQKLIEEGQNLGPRHRYYYARELYYHKEYQEALREIKKFLAMEDGWAQNKIEACMLGAECCDELNLKEEGLLLLFQSFAYDLPQPEVCCRIGNRFMQQKNYPVAVHWLKQALAWERKGVERGFVQPDYYDYIPYLQLCVCCDLMGEREKAEEYNELAGKCKPESTAYLYNKKYFAAK